MSKLFVISTDGHFIASEEFTAADLMNSMCQAMYQVFYDIAGRASAADRDQVKHDLYDMFNQGASAFLEAWIPDNLHPDSLTAEAILKAENELLAEKAAALPLDIQMQDLAADIKKEMEKDGLIPKAAAISEDNLIPFNSLDENGKPRKPVHKQ